MVIAELNHLETVEAVSVKGGIFNAYSYQKNSSYIKQSAYAAAGNGGFFNVGNVAVAANVATPIQVNL